MFLWRVWQPSLETSEDPLIVVAPDAATAKQMYLAEYGEQAKETALTLKDFKAEKIKGGVYAGKNATRLIPITVNARESCYIHDARPDSY